MKEFFVGVFILTTCFTAWLYENTYHDYENLKHALLEERKEHAQVLREEKKRFENYKELSTSNMGQYQIILKNYHAEVDRLNSLIKRMPEAID